MAPKKSKSVSGNHNNDLLLAIASATVNNSFMYVTKEEGMPLLTAGYIQVDTNQLDPSDQNKAAARITEAGTNYLKGLATVNTSVQAAVEQSNYAIMTNVPIPESKRGNFKGGGAPVKYPFASLEIGNSFFVPVSEKTPDPVKTLGSTVSSMNMHYAQETGATKTVTRTKRGPDHKALLDAQGNKVTEEKVVPEYKLTRKFVVRAIKKGDKLGDWVADSDGALVARVAVE